MSVGIDICFLFMMQAIKCYKDYAGNKDLRNYFIHSKISFLRDNLATCCNNMKIMRADMI